MIERRSFAAPGCALLALLIASWAWPLPAEAQGTPRPPTDLYAASIAGNEVELRWTAPSSGPTPTDYVLEGGVNPGEALVSIPVGSTVTALDVTAPNGMFYVRVYTLSDSSRSFASNEIVIFVNQPVAPSAPAYLLATVNGSSVSLAWRNTFTGGTPELLLLDITGTPGGTLPIRLGEVARFAGVPGGTYTLSLRAANSSGTSSASNPVTVTIPATCTGVPEPPAEFIVFKEDNTLFVRWESPLAGPAPVGYIVTVTGAFSVTITTVDRALSGTVPPGTYNIDVRGDNACGAGTPTAVQSVVVP